MATKPKKTRAATKAKKEPEAKKNARKVLSFRRGGS